jgi:WD40 repeat protein
VTAAAVSPDGRWLCAGNGYGATALWSLPNHRLVERAQLGSGFILAMAFSPDSHRLATGGAGQTISLWSIPNPRADSTDLVMGGLGHWIGHENEVWSLDYVSGNLISCSKDGSARIWSGALPSPKLSYLQAQNEWTKQLTSFLGLSADGKKLWFRYSQDQLAAWSLTNPNEELTLSPLPPGLNHVYDTLWRDGELFYEADDGWIGRYNPDLRRHARLFRPGPTNAFPYGLVTHHGHLCLVTASRNAVRPERQFAAWDLTSSVPVDDVWAENLRHARLPPGWSRCVAQSSDGAWIAQPEENNTIGLWDERRQTRARSLEGPTWFLKQAAFSRHGHLLASVGWDGAVRLWDLDAAPPAMRVLRGSPSGLSQVAFTPDDRTLVTCGTDWTTRMWSVVTRQEMLTLENVLIWDDSPRALEDGLLLWTGTGEDGSAVHLRLPALAETDTR